MECKVWRVKCGVESVECGGVKDEGVEWRVGSVRV